MSFSHGLEFKTPAEAAYYPHANKLRQYFNDPTLGVQRNNRAYYWWSKLTKKEKQALDDAYPINGNQEQLLNWRVRQLYLFTLSDALLNLHESASPNKETGLKQSARNKAIVIYNSDITEKYVHLDFLRYDEENEISYRNLRIQRYLIDSLKTWGLGLITFGVLPAWYLVKQLCKGIYAFVKDCNFENALKFLGKFASIGGGLYIGIQFGLILGGLVGTALAPYTAGASTVVGALIGATAVIVTVAFAIAVTRITAFIGKNLVRAFFKLTGNDGMTNPAKYTPRENSVEMQDIMRALKTHKDKSHALELDKKYPGLRDAYNDVITQVRTTERTPLFITNALTTKADPTICFIQSGQFMFSLNATKDKDKKPEDRVIVKHLAIAKPNK